MSDTSECRVRTRNPFPLTPEEERELRTMQAAAPFRFWAAIKHAGGVRFTDTEQKLGIWKRKLAPCAVYTLTNSPTLAQVQDAQQKWYDKRRDK